MVTRSAFGAASVSKRMVAFVVAGLAAALLAAFVGYWVNTSQPAIATSTSSQSTGAIWDTPSRTLRSGHQTMEGSVSIGPGAGGPRKRFGGIQP
jgi:hypothetical protein